MDSPLEANGARAVIGTDGAVWNANEAFCALVRLDEPRLRHLGWRQLLHAADRRYVAAHLIEVLAGDAHLRIELVRDSDGRQGWFLVEAWATT